MASTSGQSGGGDDPIQTGNWSRGILGCFDDIHLCLLTHLVPCVVFGQLAELQREDCKKYALLYLVPGLNCYLEAGFREKIRFRRNITGSFSDDLITIVLCTTCSLGQEMHEMQSILDEQARIGATSTPDDQDMNRA